MALRRRTPAWSPADLPPDIVLGWWDARHMGTGYADAAAVSSWLDRSGLGRDLAQATGANQPTFRLNGRNGLPSVRFDGGDKLTNTALGSPFNGLTKAYSAIVFSTVSGNIDKYMLSMPQVSGGNGYDMGLNNSGVIGYVRTNTVGATSSASSLSWGDGRVYLYEHQVDLDLSGSERTTYAGDFGVALVSIAGATLTSALGEVNLGDFGTGFAAGFTGDVYEVLLCNRPLYGREGDLFRRYCWRKWGAATRAA